MHKFDRHHILPRSRNGTNANENLIKMDVRHHRALHMLFETLTPREQLGKILRISSSALTEEVKSDVIKILNVREMDYWYKKQIYK